MPDSMVSIAASAARRLSAPGSVRSRVRAPGEPDRVKELDLEIGLRASLGRKPRGPSEHSEDLRRSDGPVFHGMLGRGPCPRSVEKTRAGFLTTRSTPDGGSSIDHRPIGTGFVSVVI
jgi:hypothetical protein